MRKSNRYEDYLRRSYLRYSIIIISAMFLLFMAFIAFNVLFITVRVNRNCNREIVQFISGQFRAYESMTMELAQKEEIRRLLKVVDRKEAGEDENSLDSARWEVNQILYEAANKNTLKSTFVLMDFKGGIVASNLYGHNQEIFASSPMIRGIIARIGDLPYGCVSRLGYDNGQDGGFLFSFKVVNESKEPLGYLFFDVKRESFQDQYSLDRVDDLIITDQFNNLIFATSPIRPDPMEKFPAGKYRLDAQNSFLAVRDGMRYYYMRGETEGGGIQIYTLTSVEFQLHLLFYGIIAIALIGGLMLHMLSYSTKRVARKSLKAFDQLLKSVEELGNGNLTYQLPEPLFDEFAALNEAFREKVLRLEEAMKHNNELAERKRQMELKQLEEQFNPHFVFNVLETLRYEILIDSKKASEMVVAFANLLRYSIHYGSTRVTLQTDIEYINDYLLLQKMRYNRRLTYHIDIPEELLNCRIPKLLIQPVVENSLKYAGEQKKYIEIWICAFHRANGLVLSVKDNGDGIEEGKLEELRKRFDMEEADPAHIGLYNVHRTVRLLYGLPWGLKIESRLHEGTRVDICLPEVSEEDEESV